MSSHAPAAGKHVPRPETPGDFHPLELLPWFRRFRRSVRRDLVYTFLFNCGLAAIFWVLGTVFGNARFSLLALGWVALVSNIMGYTIHGLMLVSSALGMDRRIRSRGHVVTAIYYTGLSTAGVFAGWLLLAFTVDKRIRLWFADPKWVAGVALVSFIISAILLAVVVLREREARAEAALASERVRTERMEREAVHAQLRALQAQIEPHFLFNTLANVASLVDSDPALSKRMLERFIGFLRASLAATRQELTSLSAEGDLIAAYLDVLQVRMGPRLRYAVDIDPALAQFSLPPMLLQPVVENAIRHGLEPRVEGGEVRVSAKREGVGVSIVVADTGVGFAVATRGGTGLTNVRDRLRLLYGERAALTIAENPGGGTVVTIGIPA
jgi:sensor histidine kinase YesM